MNSNLAFRLAAFLALVTALRAYSPPAGIPNPSTEFGWEIDRATPAHPASWTTSPNVPVANHYYVDKTHPNSVVVSSTDLTVYGSPAAPRKTIPEGTLAAGAFVYIHAGTYTSSDSALGQFDWAGAGTTGNPIWITGNPTTRPVIQDLVQIGYSGPASFVVLENLEISGIPAAGLNIQPRNNGDNVDHILVRNVKRLGLGQNTDSSGINISLSAGTDLIPNSTVTSVVIYNCDISYCGNPAPTGSDDHGVTGGYHTDKIWILDNVIHHVGGDSVQASHYSNWTDKLATRYYIGRNTFYLNGENGIDLKNVIDFVISQNHIYGPFSREQGWGIVMHYGSTSSYWCKNGYIIFNNIHHCSGGIYTGLSGGVDNLDIVGNTIWEIKASYGYQTDSINGGLVQIGGTSVGGNSVFRIANNTFHTYERGVLISPKAGDQIKIHGNIFSNKTDAARYEVEVPNNLQSTTSLGYNFYTGSPTFLWAGAARNLAYMKLTALQETGSTTGAITFADAVNGNFALSSATSPVIDAAVEGPVGDSAYTAFQTKWGLAIKRDYVGTARPRDAAWDFGAHESAFLPIAPTNLQVAP